MHSIPTLQITDTHDTHIKVRLVFGLDLPTDVPQEDVDILRGLQKYVQGWQRVGSTVTCNPPPVATDIDVLIHTNAMKLFHKTLINKGFTKEGASGNNGSINAAQGYPDDFVSYRKGVLNLIVTQKRGFYLKFLRATGLCKRLNLMRKDHRIAVFRAILYQQ